MTNELMTTHNQGDETIEDSPAVPQSEPKHVTFESDAFDPDPSSLKSIPKQGLQRKATPFPQSMNAKVHGPLSFPKTKVDDEDDDDEVEKDEEDAVDDDNFDDAPMPLKESSHNDDVKIKSSPTRAKRHRQRQETPIPSDMLILTGRAHTNKSDTIVQHEEDSNDAPALLKESDRDDASSIPKQGLQRKATPFPQAMIAKASHGPLTLADGEDKIDEEPESKQVGFVPDVVGGETKPRLRQGTPYAKDLESLSEQLLLEPDVDIAPADSKADDEDDVLQSGGSRATPFPADLLDMSGTIRAEPDVDGIAEEEEDMLNSKEVSFVPDIVGGETKPRLRQGTPYAKDLESLSAQLQLERDVDPTLQEDAAMTALDDSNADDDDGGPKALGRLATTVPNVLLDASGTIGAETEEDKEEGDDDNFDDAPMPLKESSHSDDVKLASLPTRTKRHRQRQETPIPSDMLILTGKVQPAKVDKIVHCDDDVDDAPSPLKESEREDVFAENATLSKDTASLIPKQGLQRKGTPMPQAMIPKAHGPLSLPKANIDDDEEQGEDDDDVFDDAPAPLKESERDDVFAENAALPKDTASSIPKQGLQRKGTPMPQAMTPKAHGPLSLPIASVDEGEEQGEDDDDDFDDAPAPLKESERDDVFAENATLPKDTASSIPKQGLQRKGTPMPQAMTPKAHGPSSLPTANVDEGEEQGEDDDDDFDDAPAPLKESERDDVFAENATLPKDTASSIPKQANVDEGEEQGEDDDDDFDDAPAPLEESERDDVFAENATLPKYTASSIPKQGLQRKGTPMPQALKAKAHGPLSLPDGDDKIDEEPESTEVGFAPDIVGGETKPRLRQGTPYVKDMESLSEQLLLEPDVQVTLQEDAAKITLDDSKADDDVSKSGGRRATPFPADLLDTSDTIRDESEFDAIAAEDNMLNPKEVDFAPDIVGSDTKPRLRQGTPYVNDMKASTESVEPGAASVRVPEKVERNAEPRKGFIPNILRKLKSPVRAFRNVAK
ncbi:hypothetical protein MHU86_7111 [Fragilaria crotonensis]|nr:hypothetical protein MHU86_7111 [Fragilaria crotonensis]